MALPLERVKSIKWFAKIRDAFSSVHYEPFLQLNYPAKKRLIYQGIRWKLQRKNLSEFS